MTAPRVLCLGGSTRPGSSSERALAVAARAATEAGATVESLTGRALILPIYDTEDSDRGERARDLVDAVRRADALVISSPGYHGMISGMMKNVLDHLEDLREDERSYLDGMAVGCISVAYGWQAAVSTLAALRTTVHALRGWPTPLGVAINAAENPPEASSTQLELLATQVTGFVSWNRHCSR